MAYYCGESISSCQNEEISSVPYFRIPDRVLCPSEKIPELISSLKTEFPNSDTSDGIKINFDPKNWVMVRPSGTEPIVRIYAEAESQDKLDTLMSEYVAKVSSIISR